MGHDSWPWCVAGATGPVATCRRCVRGGVLPSTELCNTDMVWMVCELPSRWGGRLGWTTACCQQACLCRGSGKTYNPWRSTQFVCLTTHRQSSMAQLPVIVFDNGASTLQAGVAGAEVPTVCVWCCCSWLCACCAWVAHVWYVLTCARGHREVPNQTGTRKRQFKCLVADETERVKGAHVRALLDVVVLVASW